MLMVIMRHSTLLAAENTEDLMKAAEYVYNIGEYSYVFVDSYVNTEGYEWSGSSIYMDGLENAYYIRQVNDRGVWTYCYRIDRINAEMMTRVTFYGYNNTAGRCMLAEGNICLKPFEANNAATLIIGDAMEGGRRAQAELILREDYARQNAVMEVYEGDRCVGRFMENSKYNQTEYRYYIQAGLANDMIIKAYDAPYNATRYIGSMEYTENLIAGRTYCIVMTVEGVKYNMALYTPKAAREGLYYDGVRWVYYHNDAYMEDYSGLLWYIDNWWYIDRGIVNKNYSGLYYYIDNWYYINDGKIDYNYIGLCFYEGYWYYINNGSIDREYEGLCYYKEGWYYVKNGIVDFSYTGLILYENYWYYIINGYLDSSYCGLVYYLEYWYYIDRGVLQSDYTGMQAYDGNWYYIENGVLNRYFTGFCYYEGHYLYICDGIFKTEANGLYYIADIWTFIVNGVVNQEYTGIYEYEGQFYYIREGIIDFNYNGYVYYFGETYEVINGIVIYS